jgi:hypothetical protein
VVDPDQTRLALGPVRHSRLSPLPPDQSVSNTSRSMIAETR